MNSTFNLRSIFCDLHQPRPVSFNGLYGFCYVHPQLFWWYNLLIIALYSISSSSTDSVIAKCPVALLTSFAEQKLIGCGRSLLPVQVHSLTFILQGVGDASSNLSMQVNTSYGLYFSGGHMCHLLPCASICAGSLLLVSQRHLDKGRPPIVTSWQVA